MSDNPIERMYVALAKGDIAAARACFTSDATVWHCFDGVTQDLDAAAKGWEGLITYTKERSIEDVRRHTTQDGFVQQHVFVLRSPDGTRKAWPVCLVVKIEATLITRIEEYIDRAGSFVPEEGPLKTPGL